MRSCRFGGSINEWASQARSGSVMCSRDLALWDLDNQDVIRCPVVWMLVSVLAGDWGNSLSCAYEASRVKDGTIPASNANGGVHGVECRAIITP